MPHILSMFDRNYISHYDLQGKDVTVTIDTVKAGKLKNSAGLEQKKPIVFFKGATRGLALNKTNSKSIIALYGPITETWPGKKLTLFTTQTSSPEGTVDCIRIRPWIPGEAAAASTAALAPDPEPEPESALPVDALLGDAAAPAQPAAGAPSPTPATTSTSSSATSTAAPASSAKPAKESK